MIASPATPAAQAIEAAIRFTALVRKSQPRNPRALDPAPSSLIWAGIMPPCPLHRERMRNALPRIQLNCDEKRPQRRHPPEGPEQCKNHHASAAEAIRRQSETDAAENRSPHRHHDDLVEISFFGSRVR